MGPDLQSAHGARTRAVRHRPDSLRDRAGAADPEGFQTYHSGRSQRSGGVLSPILNKPSLLKPDGCEVHRMTAGGEKFGRGAGGAAAALGAKAQDAKPQKMVEIRNRPGQSPMLRSRRRLRWRFRKNAIVGRRIRYHRPAIFSAHRRRQPARLAAEHGRLDRLLDPVRNRRGGSLSRPQGDLHGRRRQRDCIRCNRCGRRRARASNVLTIVFATASTRSCAANFDGVGAGEPGQRALDMLKIDRPTLDWVSLARAWACPAVRYPAPTISLKALAGRNCRAADRD